MYMHTESNKQKPLGRKILFFVRILKATVEKSRIRSRILILTQTDPDPIPDSDPDPSSIGGI
jgi:hypothetical protein